MQNKCLWHETHPWRENYPATPEGLAQANADLDAFEATGEMPAGSGAAPDADRYGIHYSDITINLYNAGRQRVIGTRFPIVTESATHHDMGPQAWWSNHPECVTSTWIEEISNPPVEGVQRWFHIEFDITDLLNLGDFQGDGHVDGDDQSQFASCFTGAGRGPVSSEGAFADFDGDGDVDCDDWRGFVLRWTEVLPAVYDSSCPNVCVQDAGCEDGDSCTWDHCDATFCTFIPNAYGDITHDGALNLFDIFCILDGIGGDFSTCAFEDDDLEPCGGNGVLNLLDVFAVLDAIGGIDPCCD
jgi:hypothetical protein